jgi:glycosyltransferase involved in cell wall biosynthesis
MAKITALVHTHNDAERIGRVLESLRACDEVQVVDHASTDDTVKLARDYGAVVKVKEGVPGVSPWVYAIDARHDWILCMLPTEAVSEGLEASLFEWKERHEENSDQAENDKHAGEPCSVAFQVREETDKGWRELGPHTRLVNRKGINWPGHLPPDDPNAEILPGHLLRFHKP